jgi:hypothetical protein
MSKKKTPPEKKEAAYEKDHYTLAWYSPRGFRKTWKKKKNHRNRVVRRKSKNLLHEAEGLSLNELGPVEESLTAELFRKGLTKKKVRKTGVVNLREKIRKKRYERKENGEKTVRRRGGSAKSGSPLFTPKASSHLNVTRTARQRGSY